MIGRLAQYRREGVLGINGRNVDYVSLLNDPKTIRLANDKVETKRIAKEAGVPAPELIGVIEINAHVRRFSKMLEGQERFVIKPAKGSQGAGILVIAGRSGENWRTASGRLFTEDALKAHLLNVIAGMYSLGGLGDVAMLEEVVTFADTFDDIASGGVPDIRIIVHHGVPAMAMVRLPTKRSDGKANLHKGGVGVGIDLRSGMTTSGVLDNRAVDIHPDTGKTLSGVKLPSWEDMLLMSARCYEALPLGYLGVDIVLDAEKGPLLLELNGRPGLAVQLANREGLRLRLEAIEERRTTLGTPEERVAFAKTLS